ncbi:rab-GTPase-TBC domain-containing protein [Biscogniauxia mediterranea]|nr:rab-GTPase-TBC domain-containing protein [Biscogniauxia mediterranea]
MRSLVEATARWQETLKHSSSLAELQQAVKENGPASPCILGCRSICWKAFLLNQTANTINWSHALLESRSTYASLRDHFLKYIKHPEYLTAGTSDPLADDADSPWNTLRQDEVLRAEILQDVQRLPDEPFYHQPHIQTLILDVLFIYCKLHPEVGGYRQGMHELLAPIVHVVDQDAIDPVDAASDASADLRMVEMLDASFIEHDSFALFSKVMDCAKSFYEVSDLPKDSASTPIDLSQQPPTSSIIEKSQFIHETCLYKIDPELSMHLKTIDILPQVFLIRWIRLLFSREFPFQQVIILWDTLFAVDPTFKLIDFVCTAMLVRIRWELLNADYTVALQLLLKYPPPKAPHGPHTFIDDAIFLRDHLDSRGGNALIVKYTGRSPSLSAADSRPDTPRSFGPSLRRKVAGARSPLSPSRFRPPPGGVEALFQGAAKGVLERGEKLGINQAVRDAMVEIRRNVQEAKSSMKSGRDLFSEPGPNAAAMQAVAVMDQRNKRLAAMLDESVTTLKALAMSDLEDKEDMQASLGVAAAKIQFVKVYLEDSTMDLPDENVDSTPPHAADPTTEDNKKTSAEPPSEEVAAMSLNVPTKKTDTPDSDDTASAPKASSPDPPAPPTTRETHHQNAAAGSTADPLGASSEVSPRAQPPKAPERPLPIPTRSSIAQSSFAWMLEPNEPAAAASLSSPLATTTSTSTTTTSSSSFSSKTKTKTLPAASSSFSSQQRHKRPSSNANRERTAFLFGEVSSSSSPSDDARARADDIFGLEPITRKG